MVSRSPKSSSDFSGRPFLINLDGAEIHFFQIKSLKVGALYFKLKAGMKALAARIASFGFGGTFHYYSTPR
jgi:hypothetical protein